MDLRCGYSPLKSLGNTGNLTKRRLRVYCTVERDDGNEGVDAEDDESSPLPSSLRSHSSPPWSPRRPPTVTSFSRDIVRYITSQASTPRSGCMSSALAVLMITRPASAPVAAAFCALLSGLPLYGVARMSVD